MCTHITTYHMSVHSPMGPNSSPRKFRSPNLAIEICPSPFPFMRVPQPNYPRPAKLSPTWLMVCSSCFRSNRERFSSSSTPCSVGFLLLHPPMSPLLQAAFPEQLTGPDSELPLSFELVGLFWGIATRLLCISVGREETQRTRPLDQVFQANAVLTLQYQAENSLGALLQLISQTNRKINLGSSSH